MEEEDYSRWSLRDRLELFAFEAEARAPTEAAHCCALGGDRLPSRSVTTSDDRSHAPKPIDGLLVQRLAGIACSTTDIAEIVGCSTDTLDRRFAAEIAKGRAEGRTTLRRKQWELAMGGNATMLIFLGKNMLGQADRTDVTSAGSRLADAAPATVIVRMSDAGRGFYPPEGVIVTPRKNGKHRPEVPQFDDDGLPLPSGIRKYADGSYRSLPEGTE